MIANKDIISLYTKQEKDSKIDLKKEKRMIVSHIATETSKEDYSSQNSRYKNMGVQKSQMSSYISSPNYLKATFDSKNMSQLEFMLLPENEIN